MTNTASQPGAMVPQTGLKGTGVLVPVTGPYGEGKAKLLNAVASSFSAEKALRFPACIEASNDPITSAEANKAVVEPQFTTPVQHVSFEQFSSLDRAGGLAASWQVDKRNIGIPASIIDDLAQGKVVVVNASRKVIPRLRKLHSRVHVIYLTANLDRKSGAKSANGNIPAPPVTIIDNSGPLIDATEELRRVLETYIP